MNYDLRMQVKLSRGSTKVPAGQDSTHLSFESTNPGRHSVHVSLSIVEAAVKPGMPHVVHLAGHAEREC